VKYLPTLTRGIKQSDAIHAVVPGDIGALGLFISVILRKPTFVRHCGTWGDRSTLALRLLSWFLPRVAGGNVVVMATGGGPEPPEPGNPDIEWIFATSFTRAEFESITPAAPWSSDLPLRLVTVGRLSHGKNAISCIQALPAIREAIPGTTLKVVGEGPVREELKRAVSDLGLDEAVELTGNLNHEGVLEVLCESHMFLFPTRVAEGFPKAVLEAMACGLPVVASRVSVLPYLLDEGRGVVLGGTDPSDIAGAVISLARDPGRMAATGRLAREKAGDYTLERWRDLIGARLEAAWGRPLRDEGGYPDDPTGATT
jgi:glycosyltransferase involved in cell wall biosynthesis